MQLISKKRLIYIVLLILSVCVTQAVSSLSHEASMIQRHETWVAYHRRSYKDAIEKEKRYKIFKENVEYIDKFNNAGDKPYKLGVNAFADLTNQEFKASIKRVGSPMKRTTASISRSSKKVTDIPITIDWRKKGAVTPIRNDTCGSWTFSAVDTVEGLGKIKTGKLYALSAQEIVDCNTDVNNDCGGGFTHVAFDFIKQYGLTTEAIYPSKADNGTCNTKKKDNPVVKISDYKDVPANNEKLLMDAVASVPVAVMIDGGDPGFQFYKAGIFTGQCGTELNLGATVVGYGTSNDGVNFWIVKNSWGTEWGEEGYIRMQKDVDAKEGLCGIAMEASYPIA